MSNLVFEQRRSQVPRSTTAALARLGSEDVALCLFISAFAFSPFGWSLALNPGGNFVPEPVFLVMFCATFTRTRSGQIFRRAFRSTAFRSWAILSFILALIGVSVHQDVIAAYSDFRCLVLLGFSYAIATDTDPSTKQISQTWLILMCAAVILLNAIGYFLVPVETTSVKFQYPLGALIYLFVYCVLLRPSYMYAGLVIGCAVFIALTGFYRTNFAVLFAFCLIFVIAFVLRKINSPFKLLLISVIGVPIFILALLNYEFVSQEMYNFLSATPSRYAQTIYKWNQMVQYFDTGHLSEGDEVRSLYFPYIADHTLDFFLPGGLGQKVLIDNWGSLWSPEQERMGVGSSKDGGHLFLAAHFGLVLGAAIIANFSQKLWSSYRMLASMADKAVFGILSGALALYFLTMGMMFNQTAAAFGFGACLGLMTRVGHALRRSQVNS
ncbi:hypothetical protein [Bradyrhizobium sp. 30]|uniref:hypothetical protein n=1 Tax=Bradyrhizobium sp. 30 TaxID=2782669 RepID=UPI001FFA4F5B|nr:hypothetical protein [Bradyrhizobium sp. 30]MCK1294842.1 hypothetical protein [Bradyrhizobium sp. 30]